MIAVGFDFDHTLGLDHGLEREALVLLAGELGIVPPGGEDAVRALTTDVIERFRSGELTLEEMVMVFVARVRGDARDQDDHAPRWRALCYDLVARVTAIPGARELIAQLQARGIPVAILTNGWSPLQEMKIAQALAFTGEILVSDEIGVRKPAAAAFEKLVAALGASPAECLYVGDNPAADVVGAQAAGLRGVWFDWEGLVYPRGEAPPAHVVHALSEVLDLVPGSDARTENVAS
jgi:HAD superfamily hydrolase (TIGR01509 family)